MTKKSIIDKIKENDLKELWEYKKLSLVYPQFKMFDGFYKIKKEEYVKKYKKEIKE